MPRDSPQAGQEALLGHSGSSRHAGGGPKACERLRYSAFPSGLLSPSAFSGHGRSNVDHGAWTARHQRSASAPSILPRLSISLDFGEPATPAAASALGKNHPSWISEEPVHFL